MRLAAYWRPSLTAHADSSCSSTTMSGSAAIEAGPKSVSPARSITATARTTGHATACVATSTARIASATVRTPSQTIIVRRRSSRSASAPAGSRTAKAAVLAAVPTAPAMSAECVRASTSSG